MAAKRLVTLAIRKAVVIWRLAKPLVVAITVQIALDVFEAVASAMNETYPPRGVRA